MICAKCGRAIADDSKFCTFCGARVEVMPAEPAPEVPAEPEVPEVPEVPVAPAEPAEPAPVTPVELAELVEPLEPLEPAEPLEPVEPVIEAPAESAGFAPEAPADLYTRQPQPPQVVDPYAQPQPQQPQVVDPYAQPQPEQPQVVDPYAQPQPEQPSPADPYAPPTPYAAPAQQQPQSQGAGPYPPPPYGQTPEQPYAPPSGSAYPPASAPAPQQPHKKTGLFVAIIVAVVLVLCLGLAIVGSIAFRQISNISVNEGSVTSNTTGNSDERDRNDSPGFTVPNNENGERDRNGGSELSLPNGEVVVDSDILTFVVETGGGQVWEDLEWYVVECTIENKTDNTLDMYFDFDYKMDEDYSSVDIIIMPEPEDNYEFPPHKKVHATIIFDDLSDEYLITGVTNFTGTLIVYDRETFDTIAEYPVSITSM
jgi:hypothetical protein